MAIRIVGDHPLTRDEQGRLKSRIATLFLSDHVLVTLPGIHATQRLAYSELVYRGRQAAGLAPLTGEEERQEWENSADLIMENGFLLIRPDPARMDLALSADDALQELVSKRRIRFLNVLDDRVRRAVTERGERWRISSLPHSPEEMNSMIRKSRIHIGQQPIYYYNMITGQRILTFHEFAALRNLAPAALAAQMQEIGDYAGRLNRRGYNEVAFFKTEGPFGAADFAACDWGSAGPEAVLQGWDQLRARFMSAVPPEFRVDNPDDPEWRKAMFTALITRREEPVAEAILSGLSPEFFLQIRWLPGGRVEQGELIFDPIFDELENKPADDELKALCDLNAKHIFFNLIREFGDVEYMNIGRVVGSLSTRPSASGRRDVYIVELKLRGIEAPLVRIIRLLKWGIREHLDEQKDLLRAIIEAEEYAEYVMDRRMGCRQLGMNLPNRITLRKIGERYHGLRKEFEGQLLWAMYAERDYIRGIATDKIPPSKLADPEFAVRFAQLLGKAAAVNIVVGRIHLNGSVLFDDGDEVLTQDERGLPAEIVVADHTGTFVDYRAELIAFAEGYAAPVSRRLGMVPQPAALADAYLTAFKERFDYIQQEFRKRRRAFLTLFRHGRYEQEGAFAFRWERVLERLDRTDPAALTDAIRANIKLPANG